MPKVFFCRASIILLQGTLYARIIPYFLPQKDKINFQSFNVDEA